MESRTEVEKEHSGTKVSSCVQGAEGRKERGGNTENTVAQVQAPCRGPAEQAGESEPAQKKGTQGAFLASPRVVIGKSSR